MLYQGERTAGLPHAGDRVFVSSWAHTNLETVDEWLDTEVRASLGCEMRAQGGHDPLCILYATLQASAGPPSIWWGDAARA